MENIFKNSQNNGMVKANSTRNFLGLFQKQYETGLGNRGKQMLKHTINNTNREIDYRAPIGGKNKLQEYYDVGEIQGGYQPPQPPL